MKKISLLLLALLLWIIPACDDDDDSSPDRSSTINVTINYLGNFGGDYDPTSTSDDPPVPRAGEKINYIQLYDSTSDISTTFDGATLYKEFPITANNTATVCSGIAAGTYYLVAYYDYRTGGDATNKITQADRYAIWDGATGSPLYSAAQTVIIAESSSYDYSFTIQRNWELSSSKNLITSLTGSSFTMNLSYGGTNDAYVFVYRQLELTSPRNNILYQGSISGSGTGAVTINNILTNAGSNFYVCLLLNVSTSGANVINQGDTYELFDNVQAPASATPHNATYYDSNDPDSTISYAIGANAVWQP